MATPFEVTKFRLTGSGRGLLMHSARALDKFSPEHKAISAFTAKKKKTEQDLMEIAKLEFIAGMHYSQALGPIVPAEYLKATLIAAAKREKAGQAAKSGVLVEQDFKLLYDGPRDRDKMWESGKFHFTCAVRVQAQRVMRTRPYFPQWSAEVAVLTLPDVVDCRQLTSWMETAGALVGFGDWRPEYGRFEVEVI